MGLNQNCRGGEPFLALALSRKYSILYDETSLNPLEYHGHGPCSSLGWQQGHGEFGDQARDD